MEGNALVWKNFATVKMIARIAGTRRVKIAVSFRLCCYSLVTWTFSAFKMAGGQGCQNTFKTQWNILSHDTGWNGVFGGYFQRYAVVFVFW